jgi:hypothetical protein
MSTSYEHYRTLVRQHRPRGSSTSDTFSSHLPMALAALVGTGASPEQLDRFTEHYLQHLPEPALPVKALSPDEALTCLGQVKAEPRFETLFDQQIATRGREAVLREWLAHLLPGLSAAAFHGLIRTAYGVRFDNDEEVASGMAVWAGSWQPMPAPQGALVGDSNLIAALQTFLDEPALAALPAKANGISVRMREISRHPHFAKALPTPELHDPAQALDCLTLECANRYLQSLNFTTMHAVNALHALRSLAPWLPSLKAALKFAWPALAAALISARTSRSDDVPYADTLTWPEIQARSRVQTDDHVIKTVYSFHDLAIVLHDDAFRRSASRLVSRGHA